MKCKKCGEEKTITQMAKFAGKPTETCKECRWCKDPPKAAPEAASTPAPAHAPARKDLPTECIVAASLGFTARVDGDALVISQANSNRENDDDNITLTRAEAKTLFGRFAKWADAA